jgi:hypothetical protein
VFIDPIKTNQWCAPAPYDFFHLVVHVTNAYLQKKYTVSQASLERWKETQIEKHSEAFMWERKKKREHIVVYRLRIINRSSG